MATRTRSKSHNGFSLNTQTFVQKPRRKTSSTPPVSPLAPRDSWVDEAACQGMPLEIFYGTLSEPITRKEIGMARKICSPCPARRDCLIVSLQTNEPHGVWAGLTHKERRVLLARFKGDWTMAAYSILPPLTESKSA